MLRVAFGTKTTTLRAADEVGAAIQQAQRDLASIAANHPTAHDELSPIVSRSFGAARNASLILQSDVGSAVHMIARAVLF